MFGGISLLLKSTTAKKTYNKNIQIIISPGNLGSPIIQAFGMSRDNYNGQIYLKNSSDTARILLPTHQDIGRLGIFTIGPSRVR